MNQYLKNLNKIEFIVVLKSREEADEFLDKEIGERK